MEDEQTCRFFFFLEEYFEGNSELLCFIKRDTCSCDINSSCNISSEEGVNRFGDFYMEETNETIKLKYKKKDKQRNIFNVKATYKCHHKTRYKGTREVDTVLTKILSNDFETPIILVK